MVAYLDSSALSPLRNEPVGADGRRAGVRETLKILVIDDEMPVRQSLQMLLEFSGHDVIAAEHGGRGVELASTRAPDLVLCDVQMPVMDGYGVLEALQKNPATRDIPFIFLTGCNERKDLRRGMSMGAADYLTKPFTHDELNAAIAACRRKHIDFRERLKQYAQRQELEEAAPWAHELLTPINGVLGYASLLEEEAEEITPEQLREMAGAIRRSGERQLALAQKILAHFELSRLAERGVRRQASAFAGSLEAGCDAAVKAARREPDMTLSCAPAAIGVPAHLAERLGFELVENACKFSEPGARITIAGVVADDCYLFEVSDAGVGMSADERLSIAPFRQFGRDKREQQGLGLGLSLVRSIVELHGGSLDLGEGHGGRGLRARVKLPLAGT